MWRSIGRNNSDRGPSSSFRKGMRGGRYDTVGDTPSVRHFSSEQPVLRNVHLVDHPGATRNRSGRWKEDIPFPSSEDVHPSEFRSKKLDDNACLVLPAKGKERKGKARRGRNHASARHRSRYGSRGEEKDAAAPFLLRFLLRLRDGGSQTRSIASGARKTRRGLYESLVCTHFNPRP